MITWKQEIFRAFLLAFGTGQIIANVTYLIKKNGIDLARRQHHCFQYMQLEKPYIISIGKPLDLL